LPIILGFIAEEVGKVLPEIVAYEENGIDAKGLDYSKMTPLLVEAFNALRKEYQEQMDQLTIRMNDQMSLLKAEIALLKPNTTNSNSLVNED
jgi:hypothetical protein